MKFFREPLNWIAIAVVLIALCYAAQTYESFRQANAPMILTGTTLTE